MREIHMKFICNCIDRAVLVKPRSALARSTSRAQPGATEALCSPRDVLRVSQLRRHTQFETRRKAKLAERAEVRSYIYM